MMNYIYGAGGHGKVVLDAMYTSSMNCAGFIDDKEILEWYHSRVFRFSEMTFNEGVSIHLAIGSCKVREAIAHKLSGKHFFNVTHPSACISQTARLGTGCFSAAQSIIAPDALVGNHCIINHGAVVDHDCIVGNFSHIAPQSSLGGGVKVGKGVLIGAGSVVLPGLTIGDYAVIGAGAVVTRNVLAGVTVVGNPAHPIKSKEN